MPGEPLLHTEHPNDPLQFLSERYQQLKVLDNYKNDLIEELLVLCKNNEDLYHREAKALQLEMAINRNPQIREMKLLESVRQMQAIMDRRAFMVVLIDGHQVIFRDDFLQRGQEGGHDAAVALWQAAIHYIEDNQPEIHPETKVAARIYANFEVLAENLYQRGIIENSSLLKAFFRGFTSATALFDFVDVPADEEVLTQKVTAVFNLHLHDYQCKRILFGCANSSQYDNLLLDTVKDPQSLARVAFMDVLDASQELPLRKANFKDLFRVISVPELPGRQFQGHTSRLNVDALSNVDPSTYRDICVPDSDTLSSSSTNFPSLPPAQVASTSDSTKSRPSTMTWALTAAKPSSSTVPLIFPTVKGAAIVLNPTMVYRNRKGQRVDPHVPCTREETIHVKNLKLCNIHFLRQDCPHGSSCTHVHKHKPTSAELRTLRYVARMAPCMSGSACDEVMCNYGHMCPHPEGRNGDKCGFGVHCRFPVELHGIDKTVVKTIGIK